MKSSANDNNSNLDANVGNNNQKVTGSEKVYQILRREIIDMEILPGTAIDETALAKRFGLSRSPIREALVRLSEVGLIQNEKNKNPIVTPFNISTLPKYIEALSVMQRITARLSAINRTEQDIEIVEDNYHAHLKAYSECKVKEMIELNRKFHVSISAGCKNPYFHKLYSSLLDDSYRYLRFHFYTYDDELPEEYIHDHKALLEALKRQDVQSADVIAKDHAAKVWNQFTNFLKQNPNFGISLEDMF